MFEYVLSDNQKGHADQKSSMIDELPSWVDGRKRHCGDWLPIYQLPKNALSAGIVSPNQTCLPGTKKVPGASDFPAWINIGKDNRDCRRAIVHQPNLALTGHTIFPDQVGLLVTKEISNTGYVPTR